MTNGKYIFHIVLKLIGQLHNIKMTDLIIGVLKQMNDIGNIIVAKETYM